MHTNATAMTAQSRMRCTLRDSHEYALIGPSLIAALSSTATLTRIGATGVVDCADIMIRPPAMPYSTNWCIQNPRPCAAMTQHPRWDA